MYKVHAFEKQAFLGTLWELTVKHARLPNSMVITDEIDPPASIQIPKSGGFADIKQGQYKGYTVAVKKLRVWMGDDFHKVRMVSGKEVSAVKWNGAEIISSSSVERLSFGTRFPIQMSSNWSVFWVISWSVSSPRCRSGWNTVPLWSTSVRTPRTG